MRLMTDPQLTLYHASYMSLQLLSNSVLLFMSRLVVAIISSQDCSKSSYGKNLQVIDVFIVSLCIIHVI